jgi:hypothetical protein
MTYDAPISISPVAADASVSDITFREALAGIKSGRWATKVDAVRKAHKSGGKEASDGPKKLLPGVTFSGKFSYRSAAKIVQHSGLICADMDNLGDQVGAYKERFACDPHVIAVFVSPTETGLKAIFRCDPTRPHKESFESLEHYVIQHFGIPPDEKCKDASRLCFVSHDPELIETDDADVIPYLPARPKPETEARKDAPAETDLQPGEDFNRRGGSEVPALLKKHGWTHHQGKYWCRPGKENSVSASWDVIPNVFHPFSNSPETRLPSDIEGFDPYGLFTWLEHGGDYTASTRALGKAGYGKKQETIQEKNLNRLAGTEEKKTEGQPQHPARPLFTLEIPPPNDPSSILGNRYLNKGDGAVFSSSSGMGKSAAAIQAGEAWSLGEDFVGIKPSKPLRILYIQSEDSDGDVAEVTASIIHVRQRTPEQIATVNKNFLIVSDRTNRGKKFLDQLEIHIKAHKPDLVIINPLQAFIDGDVTDSQDLGKFLREGLNSLNEPAAFAYLLIHHTTKPATGKDRSERLWHEVMYDMAGGAELINWARAILSLRATPTEGEFNLVLAKRGRRAGVTKAVSQGIGERQEPVTIIPLKHAKGFLPSGQPLIYWEPREATEEEPKVKLGGRDASNHFSDYASVFPAKGTKGLPLNRLHRDLEQQRPISKPTLFKALKRWAEAGDVEIVPTPGASDHYRKAF